MEEEEKDLYYNDGVFDPEEEKYYIDITPGYPLANKEQVQQAINCFNHITFKFERNLAYNITKKIIEYKLENWVHVPEYSHYYPYYIRAFSQNSNKKTIKLIRR